MKLLKELVKDVHEGMHIYYMDGQMEESMHICRYFLDKNREIK